MIIDSHARCSNAAFRITLRCPARDENGFPLWKVTGSSCFRNFRTPVWEETV